MPSAHVSSVMLPAGAWSEFVVVQSQAIAPIPTEIDFGVAATLPVAGLTALHALAKGGSLLGKHVLVNGASGGVGTLLSGAHVVAAIRKAKDEALVRRLCADVVVVAPDLSGVASYGPFDLVLESVGGRSLAAALSMLATNGLCVSFGASQSSEVMVDTAKFRVGATSLDGLALAHELRYEPPSVGLGRLMALVQSGWLIPEITLRDSWSATPDIAARLMARSFAGKAVLHINDGPVGN